MLCVAKKYEAPSNPNAQSYIAKARSDACTTGQKLEEKKRKKKRPYDSAFMGRISSKQPILPKNQKFLPP
jgi:hypothetical protein